MSEIAKAINNIMKEVGYVQKVKSSDNGGIKYSYAGEKVLIEAIRPVMVSHGVSVMPINIQVVDSRDVLTTSKGNTMSHAVIIATYRFLHISGEYQDVMVTGEGGDSLDKAFNKAMTSAFKYALRQTFTIETGDEASPFATDDGWSDEFIHYCINRIPRYKNNPYKAKNALRKKFDNGPQTKAEAEDQFLWLKQHGADADLAELDDEELEAMLFEGDEPPSP